MEELLKFMIDQRLLDEPDDELKRLVDDVLSRIQPPDSGSLDETELEFIQAATGTPYQQTDTIRHLNSTGELFTPTENKI